MSFSHRLKVVRLNDGHPFSNANHIGMCLDCVMAVVYATDWKVERSTDGQRATIEQVAEIVGDWAEISAPMESAERFGRRGALVHTEYFDGDLHSPGAWRLSLSHLDPRDSTTTWTVSVLAVEQESTDVSVRLDRTRDGHLLLPIRDEPRPPGCIRTLLESKDLAVVDGGHRLSADVWVPEDSEAFDVASLIASDARRLPIFGFTLRDDDVIDGSVVTQNLAGLAHVILIRSTLSWLLDDLLPIGLNVYGGAARLWWPGLSGASSRWDHPLWRADFSARRITNFVEEVVLNAAIARSTTDTRFLQFEKRKRDINNQIVETELQELRNEVARAKIIAGQSGVDTVDALSDTIERLISAERNARIAAEEERDLIQAMAMQIEEDMAAARRRAGSAELLRDYWKAEFERLNTAMPALSEMNASDQAFRAEVDREIRSRGDIDGDRPRDYLIGSRFMSKLDSMGQGTRSKVIKACADLVINAPQLLARRDNHALRSGVGAESRERRRERDGAKAMRCAIEQRTSSARRIHYWDIPSGVVEFASVNVHDDFTIPE